MFKLFHTMSLNSVLLLCFCKQNTLLHRKSFFFHINTVKSGKPAVYVDFFTLVVKKKQMLKLFQIMSLNTVILLHFCKQNALLH